MADHYNEGDWALMYNQVEADGNWYRVWYNSAADAWGKELIPRDQWAAAGITAETTVDYFKDQNYSTNDMIDMVNKLFGTNIQKPAGSTAAPSAPGSPAPVGVAPAGTAKPTTVKAPAKGGLPSWALPVGAGLLILYVLKQKQQG